MGHTFMGAKSGSVAPDWEVPVTPGIHITRPPIMRRKLGIFTALVTSPLPSLRGVVIRLGTPRLCVLGVWQKSGVLGDLGHRMLGMGALVIQLWCIW